MEGLVFDIWDLFFCWMLSAVKWTIIFSLFLLGMATELIREAQKCHSVEKYIKLKKKERKKLGSIIVVHSTSYC